jgi:hypothetical protein
MTITDVLRKLRQSLATRQGQLIAALLQRSTSPELEHSFVQIQRRIAAVRAALARNTAVEARRAALDRARAERQRLRW